MGLIDLKTNLKSLRYGNDQRGGGSSNQPYIVTPIPDGFGETAPDFLLRNGYLNSLSSTQDVSRLTRMFLDTKSPNGLLFVTKQELLERQNVVVQNGFDRIYNPLGTLAQAGVISTGYHLNKQGLNPLAQGYFDGGRNGYYSTTLDNNKILDGEVNRLYKLYKIKQSDDASELENKEYEISSNPTLLLSYPGGPNSVLGFGNTNIRIQNPTRIVTPQTRATKAYISTTVTNVGYLTPSGSFTINWNYKPITTGVTKQYFEEILKTDGNFGDLLNNNMLNRDTSTIIPIGKPKNTFVKSQNLLKSEPGYLVPNNIEGNVIYQTSLTGSSDVFKDKILRLDPGYINQAQKVLPTGSLYNTSSIDRVTYSDERVGTNIFTNENVRSFTAASRIYGIEEDTVLDNFNQTAPATYPVEDDIVEGLEENRTTTLASLNPQYFRYNKTINSVDESENAFIVPLKEFNRETTYQTSQTTYKSPTRDDLAQDFFAPNTDKVNLSGILQPTGSQVGAQQKEIDDLKQSDLVKFYFEINNNNSLSDTQNWFLFFRAYINDLGDSYKPDWQSYKYIGRAENFYKYSGFSRDISLGFTIYAHSVAEMEPIYKKLNYLVGTTAPDYSEAGYMRGNFINLTVGDYLDNVPGIIQGIDLKPSFDAGWEIDRSVVSGKPLGKRLQLPRMIDVTLQFTPIHTFTPQFKSPFIR